MGEDKIDVASVRAEYLEQKKAEVVKAFENRKVVPMVKTSDGGFMPVEELRSMVDDARSVKGAKPETIITFKDTLLMANQVQVENSHDYKTLLEIAIKTAGPDLPEEKQKEIRDFYLKHEYEHAVPGLGVDTLKMTYLISFFEDTYTGTIVIRGGFKSKGSAPAYVYKDILRSPEELSTSDYIKTTKVRDRDK